MNGRNEFSSVSVATTSFPRLSTSISRKADLIDRGMAREEAEQAARREFGNVTRIEDSLLSLGFFRPTNFRHDRPIFPIGVHALERLAQGLIDLGIFRIAVCSIQQHAALISVGSHASSRLDGCDGHHGRGVGFIEERHQDTAVVSI